jgi:hypothetical protein
MRKVAQVLLGTILALGGGSIAKAATYDLTLNGDVSNVSESTFPFNGQTYQQYVLGLTGLDSSDPVTVSQGDMIDVTVNLSAPYTIPASQAHTDFLLNLTGSSFPSENTGVSGTFDLYDQGILVAEFGYGSTTSNSLSNYAALLPPNNIAYQFTSFTDDFTITDLMTSATLDGSDFTYALVSNGVPEPASWAMMLLGVAAIGGMSRARRTRSAAC